jgi:hypothetical protein
MKRLIASFTVLALIGILGTPQTYGQGGPGRGGRGWGPGSPYGRMYDTNSVETIKGEVISVDRFPPRQGMSSGVHLQVKTATETISVHLGPSWYLDNQEPKVAAQDNIEVKGSRITFDGKPVIIAAEVTKGDKVLKLRDENGFPMWAGGRRR